MQDLRQRSTFSSSLRQAPADLIAIGLCVMIVIVTTLPMLEDTAFQIVIQALFVGVVPGYALVAALYPRLVRVTDRNMTESPTQKSDNQIRSIERVALSIATSCGLLAITAWGLPTISIADKTTTTVWALAGLTISFVGIAAICRLLLPPSEQFSHTVIEWINVLDSFRSVHLRRDLFSTVAFGLVVLVLLSSVAYAIVPVQEDGYTELYLLHEGNNQPVAEEYPNELTVGEEQSLIIGIGNEEETAMTYTIIVQLQEIEVDGSEMNVQSSTELDRFEVNLEDGETVENEHTVTPQRTGNNLRLTYLLYIGEPSNPPTEENAYRSTYIWVDVTDSNE